MAGELAMLHSAADTCNPRSSCAQTWWESHKLSWIMGTLNARWAATKPSRNRRVATWGRAQGCAIYGFTV